MVEKSFNNVQIDYNKLIAYGFKKCNNIYTFEKQIVDKQFTLKISVDSLGIVSTNVIDNTTHEEYVLHLLDDLDGAFVGRVRAEYITH